MGNRQQFFIRFFTAFLFGALVFVRCGLPVLAATVTDITDQVTTLKTNTAANHKIIFTTPTLTPFLTDDSDWKSLTGISLACQLMLYVDGRKDVWYEGSFLFTHFGFSGPVALNISRYWIRRKEGRRIELHANFIPETQENVFREKLTLAIREYSRRPIKKFLLEQFPERFVEVFLKKIQIEGETVLSQLKKEDRERWIQSCIYFPDRKSVV